MGYYENTGNQARAQQDPGYEQYTQPAPASSYETEDSAQIEMGRNSGKRVSIFKVIIYVFVGFALLGAVIFSNVQKLQLDNTITNLNQEYMSLQSENVRMQSILAGKTSNKNIQEYAENVLGMQIVDGSQIEYVEIQTNDVVAIPEEEQNVFLKLKSWFDNLVEYLRG